MYENMCRQGIRFIQQRILYAILNFKTQITTEFFIQNYGFALPVRSCRNVSLNFADSVIFITHTHLCGLLHILRLSRTYLETCT